MANLTAQSPDEPFSVLDAITRLEMQKLLLRLVQGRRIATLLVTHDIDEALFLGDRILLMSGNPADSPGIGGYLRRNRGFIEHKN